MSQICIFEDNGYSQLIPLVYTRATFELRCGLFAHQERIARHYPNNTITLFCRDYLAPLLQERYTKYYINKELPVSDSTCLFINGSAILSDAIPTEGPEEIGVHGNRIVYIRLTGDKVKNISVGTFFSEDSLESIKHIAPVIETQIPVINYFWDIIDRNKSQLKEDFDLFVKNGSSYYRNLHNGVYFINKNQIFIGKDSEIKPCCVIDAGAGPVYIGNNVNISPNATIEGPAYIGDHSLILPNARLRCGSNIGEVCKIGGETINTVFQAYTNKQHDGFFGDSYIGSWVNIGANTTNSNLLNTYGNINVDIAGDIINTKHMFLGAAIGDHTKTAINTSIMTASIFGFACNIVTPIYAPKYLPSFTWNSDRGMKVHTLEKALRVAKIVMGRRGKTMTAAEEQLFREVFEITKKERSRVYAKKYKT